MLWIGVAIASQDLGLFAGDGFLPLPQEPPAQDAPSSSQDLIRSHFQMPSVFRDSGMRARNRRGAEVAHIRGVLGDPKFLSGVPIAKAFEVDQFNDFAVDRLETASTWRTKAWISPRRTAVLGVVPGDEAADRLGGGHPVGGSRGQDVRVARHL